MFGGQEEPEGADQIMDLGEGNNTPRVRRAKATNWPRVMSKFLLDWYLEKKKGMQPKAKFKKEHHVWCTSAVNAKFKTTFSVDQVHRHFRRFKEIWIVLTRYVNENGSRFDKKHKMLVLPQSTMARLPITERAIIAKPIPFFDHLLALFNDGQLDAVCMRNPVLLYDSGDELEAQDALNVIAACVDTNEEGEDTNKDREENKDGAEDKDRADLDHMVLEGGDDHDEVAASSGEVPCEVMSGTSPTASPPSAQPSGSAESTLAALKRSATKMKIVSKATPTPKPHVPVWRDGRNISMLNNKLVGFQDIVTKPVRASTSDPNAPLWNMLKEISLTPADRLSVGIYLCKPECEVHRSFFMNMGKEYLEAWAGKFLSGEEPGAL